MSWLMRSRIRFAVSGRNSNRVKNLFLHGFIRHLAYSFLLVACYCVMAPISTFAADKKVSAQQALAIRPVLRDSECETPDAKTIDQCKITVEKYAKGSGWAVTAPTGQLLRRFVDSNADDVVDQWRYYKDGLEVYRDIDTDYNSKVDQMRWFNTSGSRWAIDKNEDGKIDYWKVLSPEEASREVIKALVARDERLLGTLMVSADDLTRLGIQGPVAESIQKNFSKLGDQLDKLSKSKMLQPKAQWMQFQGTFPSVIPGEQVGCRDDIVAHQNAMTMVDNGGQTGLLQLGTLIKVGEVWKLTRLPQPLEGNSVQVAEDALFSPLASTMTDVAQAAPMPNVTLNPKSQKLIEDLQALDKKTPPPTASKTLWAEFNRQRTVALDRLIDASQTAEEREQWEKQLVDGIAAGVQADTYDKGLELLQVRLADSEKKSPKSPLIAYITYRIETARYGQELRKAPVDKTAEIQEHWLKTLEGFVKRFPSGEDAPEAMFQLGSTYEFAGKLKDARLWYEKLATSDAKSTTGLRAAGALRRLNSKGQRFALRGTTLSGAPFDVAAAKGKVVLVIYWSNWSEPLVNDLPRIRALEEKYGDRGLEIVGVSLDSTKDEAQAWIAEHKDKVGSWTQLYEPGGLEGSPLSVNYGIILLPSLFVVDRDGEVAYRGTAAEELTPVFTELFQEKKQGK
ncbi:MAG: alkyl hydroperoxide reductase/Thiol specific antioxidant/Mal allergen [Planctomycetaceae bacterium]|nr:alkyl hydroperoxide reductase/Thiol specific antioxidant/Mal allergen [Planctomycetaceae bacterium]